MRRGLALLLALWTAAASPLAAEEIVSGMSQTRVSIDANFDGTSILIYGAATREEKAPTWPLLQVIVTVEGPARPVVVRKKERVAGIWVNRGWVEYDSAPSFYAVMSTGPLDEVLSQEEDLAYGVSVPHVVGASTMGPAAGPGSDYLEALQRIRGMQGSYVLSQDSVLLLQQALFRTEVALPANLTEGEYKVRIFLTRGGAVVDMQEGQIVVSKEGLERFLYRMAQEQPALYGMISLLLAAIAGGLASELFRRFRL